MSLPEYPTARGARRQKPVASTLPSPRPSDLVSSVACASPFVVSMLSECKFSQYSGKFSYASKCGPSLKSSGGPAPTPTFEPSLTSVIYSPDDLYSNYQSLPSIFSSNSSAATTTTTTNTTTITTTTTTSTSSTSTTDASATVEAKATDATIAAAKTAPQITGEEFTWFRGKRILLPLNLSSRVGLWIPSSWRNAPRDQKPDAPTTKIRNAWWELQRAGRGKLVLRDQFDWSVTPSTKRPLKLVGGVDISFAKNSDVDACASVVVCEFPSLRVVYEAYSMCKLTAPYVVGLLAFREVEHIAFIINRMRETVPHFIPDVLLVDGQGLLHMRNYGLACHLGATVDIPTIGIGKTLLVCEGISHDVVDGVMRRATVDPSGDKWGLLQGNKGTEAYAVEGRRTKNIRLYVSQGHRISLQTAREVVFACLSGKGEAYLPEPVHQADALSRDFLRDNYKTLGELA